MHSPDRPARATAPETRTSKRSGECVKAQYTLMISDHPHRLEWVQASRFHLYTYLCTTCAVYLTTPLQKNGAVSKNGQDDRWLFNLHLSYALYTNVRPPKSDPKANCLICSPARVSTYFCAGEFGESGSVIRRRPRATKGSRCLFLK